MRGRSRFLHSTVNTHYDVNMSLRELAYQIAEQFRVLGKPLGLKECIIVGGMGNYFLISGLRFLFFCFLQQKKKERKE